MFFLPFSEASEQELIVLASALPDTSRKEGLRKYLYNWVSLEIHFHRCTQVMLACEGLGERGKQVNSSLQLCQYFFI